MNYRIVWCGAPQVKYGWPLHKTRDGRLVYADQSHPPTDFTSRDSAAKALIIHWADTGKLGDVRYGRKFSIEPVPETKHEESTHASDH